MSKTFRFTLHDKPREAADSGGKGLLTTFFAIGIVNPMGPTLNVIAADGLGDAGDRLPLVHLMLNPFSQECWEIGTVEIGESWNPASDLEPIFSLPLGACPTFLLPSAYYSSEHARRVFTRLLQKFSDGSEVLGRLRKYPGDPWERVKAEMGGIPGRMAQRKSESRAESEPRLMTAAEADEFAGIQLEEKNLTEEFRAFMFAWKGSIDFSGFGAAAMSQEDFVKVFGRLAPTCRLPFMRNIIDHPEILKS